MSKMHLALVDHSTKTSTLNPRRIHEIYVDYVDEHLFIRISTWISRGYFPRGWNPRRIYSDVSRNEILRFIEKVGTLNTRRHTIWQNLPKRFATRSDKRVID